MPVPSSGPLGLRSDIALEVDGSATGTNVSLRALSNTAGFVTPDAMSEFRGYSSDTIHLIYDSSESSSLWNFSSSPNEGTSCSDTISVNATVTNVSASFDTHIAFEIEDTDGDLYLDAFDVYYAYNVSANTDIELKVQAGYIEDIGGGFTRMTVSQTQTIRNYDQTGSGTGVFSVNALTSSSPRTHVLFSLIGQDSTNSATISLYDINTRLACPQ